MFSAGNLFTEVVAVPAPRQDIARVSTDLAQLKPFWVEKKRVQRGNDRDWKVFRNAIGQWMKVPCTATSLNTAILGALPPLDTEKKKTKTSKKVEAL